MSALIAGASILLASYVADPKPCRVEWTNAAGVLLMSDWVTRKTAEQWADFGNRQYPGYGYRFRCRPKFYV